ncbi:MAG TPA: glycosyl hydrolase family 28 protein [Pseudomonadales bacterium]|nr:glycosyl hydrolase family 28 protein [Pseudomonadales bacterium]
MLRSLGLRFVLILVGLAATSVRAVNPAMPTIPTNIFVVTDYGAIGDGAKDNTASIQKTIDTAHAAGGGIVEIPAGTFLSGPLTLSSRMNLRVEAGGILRMEPLGTYPGGYTNAPTFITADQAQDLELSGRGTIDGQGAPWWQAVRAGDDINRPMMMQFYSCHRLFIHDITFMNPPGHHCGLRKFGGDITISNLTVNTDPNSPNTDGLNFVGTNSIIENCHITDGDDNIAMGSTGPLDGLLITNCVFGYGHGVSFGSGTQSGAQNLEVVNCSFTGGTFGIRMKADTESGGLVHRLFYHDLTMTNVQMPILIYSYYRSAGSPGKISKITPAQAAAFKAGPVTRTTPIWRDITFSNITATATVAGGAIWGLPQMPVSNVNFVNVDITAPGSFNIYNARDIHFDNCRIQLGGGKKFTLYNAEGVVSKE